MIIKKCIINQNFEMVYDNNLSIIVIHSGVAKIKLCNVTFVLEPRSIIYLPTKIKINFFEIIEILISSVLLIDTNNLNIEEALYIKSFENNYFTPIIHINEIDYILINECLNNNKKFKKEIILYIFYLCTSRYNCKQLKYYKEFDVKTIIGNYQHKHGYNINSLRNFSNEYGYSCSTILNYWYKNRW